MREALNSASNISLCLVSSFPKPEILVYFHRNVEILLENRNTGIAAKLDDDAARDASETVIAGRGPDFALPNDEEVRGVAGGNKSVRIKHQRFVGAGLCGLYAGGDAIDLGAALFQNGSSLVTAAEPRN